MGEESWIWSAGPRTDESRLRAHETPYRYFDRVAGAVAEAARGLIDEWLHRYPEAHRADIIGRLRSSDLQFEGAFWELYLWELFRRAGWSLDVHPSVPASSRQPDFVLTADENRCYVEATVIDRKPAQLGEAARVEQVYDLLREFSIDEPFYLYVGHMAVGARALAVRPLRGFILRWLGELRWSEEIERYRNHGIGAVPERRWHRDDWELELLAIPCSRSDVGPHGALGTWGPAQGSIVENDIAVRAAVESKAKAYGPLDAPLVIALLCNTDIPTDPRQVERALYGLHLPHPPDVVPSPATLQPDGEGFWVGSTGWRNESVPLVITASNLGVLGLCTLGAQPISWPHPDGSVGSPFDHRALSQATLGPLEIHAPTLRAAELLEAPSALVGEN